MQSGRGRDDNHRLLNGHSLTHLTGARATARTEIEVYFPDARSLADVLSAIKSMGKPGRLEINFSTGGTAQDMRWRENRDTAKGVES